MEPENNSQPAPQPGPDFNAEIRAAQQTGDFDFVLDTAKKSKKMLCDFRDAIRGAMFPGGSSVAVGMGLNFLENMIASSDGQINALKRAERESKEAVKKVLQDKGPETQPDPNVQEPTAPPPASPSPEATNG